VREQGGGHSSIAFDYRIVAERAGYENVRLADLTKQFQLQEAQRGRNRGTLSSERAPGSGRETVRGTLRQVTAPTPRQSLPCRSTTAPGVPGSSCKYE
jgi:hypothetical protein